MCKLWNRIFYGESQMPKYIAHKSKWLYKNKWVSDHIAYDALANNHISYTYSLCTGEFASFGDTYDFNEIIELVRKYPTTISFPDYTQFSTQELTIIAGIQKQLIEKKRNEIIKTIDNAKDKFEKICLK